MKHLTTPLLVGIAALFAGVFGPATRAVVIQKAGETTLAWEAETQSTIINGTPAFWVRTNDAAASGGNVLYIGGTTDNALAPHSFVQYQLKFATAGTYNLYYRWKADAARTVADQFTGNSTLMPNALGALNTAGPDGLGSFRTSTSNSTQAPGNNVYDWSVEPEVNAFVITDAEVAAGAPLILTIATREAGFTLDRIILSPQAALTDAALDAIANSDTSIVTQGRTDTHVALEAEDRPTIINGSPAFWVSTNDPTAGGGRVLYIAGSTDNALAPHSFAQYQILFTAPGAYNLYYRWKADAARTVADQFTGNSTLVPNTLGAFSTAGPDGLANFRTSTSNSTQAPGNNVYDWSVEPDVNAFIVIAEEVAAGVPLVLTIATREAGFTLDRIVLSPELALTDAALDALPNSGARVTGPEVTRAAGSDALNTVRLFFTRPLAPSSVATSRFTINGGLNVTAAALNTDDPRQVLLTTSAQTQGTPYIVTVNGVTDTSGNAIAANSTVNFTGWKLAEGWATTEIYHGITGDLIDDLKNAPAFIARTPDEVRWVKGFQLNNDPRAPNMGARISALFSPSASGAHNFYVNNDNEAELLLSTDQSDANLQSLGVFPLSPAVFDDAIVAPSPAVTAGQRYQLVGLVKSGGADAYLNVAAQPANSTTPAASLSVLGGSRISTFVNPDIGNVKFTQQPANAAASTGSRATFSTKVETTEQPVYYQWQVNGVDIPGATRRVYTTPVLAAADSGKNYRVVVSVAGKDTPSANASLTVNAGEPSNLQPYIGINFVGGGDQLPGRLTPVDVAGAVPQENWNNLAGNQFDQAALANASGAATPVTLTAQATEHWYSGTLGAGDPSGVMLQGFLSTGAGTDPFIITLNYVPQGNYNVIVYSLGFPFQAAYEEDITVTGAGTYPTYRVRAESGLEYNANPALRRMDSTDAAQRESGNYVQFDNVSPAADGTIAISTTWVSTAVGNTHQPAVNGIQLVRVNPVAASPVLSVSRTGSTLNITWGAGAAGFTLESTGALGASATWAPVAGVANPIAGAGSASVNLSGGSRAFYRLRKTN